jgi:hypothetical protein
MVLDLDLQAGFLYTNLLLGQLSREGLSGLETRCNYAVVFGVEMF